jgi:hypothetical protein
MCEVVVGSLDLSLLRLPTGSMPSSITFGAAVRAPLVDPITTGLLPIVILLLTVK